MYELAKFGGYLLSPLTLVVLCGIASLVFAATGRRRAAIGIALGGYAALWILSTPILAHALRAELESRHPPLTVAETPAADAIVVLGGALSGAYPPQRPTFNLSPAAGRVWHTAALYRAGKARWVIVAAGNVPSQKEKQPEAQAIREMLVALGVPAEAILIDGASRNTREDAQHAGQHVRALGAKSVLLVTSAIHMERALLTFTMTWSGQGIRLIPATADYGATEAPKGLEVWVPTASALGVVTSAIKEYAGIATLFII